MEAKNRGGRPGRDRAPGERVPLGLRVSADLKRNLDHAAAMSGRSQSQEAEFRLEMSFRDQGLTEKALTLAYGPRFAGIILLLAEAADRAGRHDAMMSNLVGQSDVDPADWPTLPIAFDAMAKVMTDLLATLRPEGEAKCDARWESMAEAAVGIFLSSVLHPDRAVNEHRQAWAERVRALLGPMLDHVSDPRRTVVPK